MFERAHCRNDLPMTVALFVFTDVFLVLSTISKSSSKHIKGVCKVTTTWVEMKEQDCPVSLCLQDGERDSCRFAMMLEF